jgi:autotransporter translocation and assembly factor TamB
MKKKILTAGAAVLICMTILVAGFFGYSRTDHARNLLLDQINTRIPGTLSAGQMEILGGGALVRLADLELQDLQGNTCLAFDTLGLAIRLRSLADRVLEISDFHIDGLRLDVSADGTGGLNILDALVARSDPPPADTEKEDSTASGIPVNVKIKTARITNGALRFSDPVNTFSVGRVDVKVSDADLLQLSAGVSVNIQDAIFKTPDETVDVRTLSVSGVLEEKNSGRFLMDLDSDLCVLNAAGSVSDMFGSPAMDLTLAAAVHLAAVSRTARDMPGLGGTIHLDITGQGPVNNPAVQVQIKGEHLGMAPDIQDGDLTLSMTLDRQALRIEQGQVNLLGVRLDFTGSTDLAPVFPDGFLHPPRDMDHLAYELSFDQTGGDFTRLAPWIPGFSGRFSSHGRLQGRGFDLDTLWAGYELGVLFKAFKPDGGEIDPLDLDARLSGSMENQVLHVADLRVDTRAAELTGSARYDMGEDTVNAEIFLVSDDLDDVTQAFGLFPVKGKLQAAVHAAGPVSGPDISATVSGRELGAAGISVAVLDFEASLNRTGRAEILGLTVQGPGMDLTASGAADLFDAGFALRDKIRADVTASGTIRPETFLAGMDLAVDPQYLDSVIEFDLKTHADYAMGAAVGMADIKDIVIPQRKLGAKIDLKEKRFSLSIEDLADIGAALDMEKSAYAATFDFTQGDFGPLLAAAAITGISVGLDGWIRAQGSLPADVTAQISDQLAAADGTLEIAADVRGTVAQPAFTAVLSLADLAWQMPEPGIAVSELNGRITLTPDHATIQEVTARVNQGQVTLAGEIDFPEYILQGGRLAVQANHLDIPSGESSGDKTRIAVSDLSAALAVTAGITAAGKKNTDQLNITLTLSGSDIVVPVSPDSDGALRVESLASSLEMDLDYSKLAAAGSEKKDGAGSNGAIPVKTIRAVLGLNEPEYTGLNLSLSLDQTIGLGASFDPDTSEFDLDLALDKTRLAPFLETAGVFGITAQVSGRIQSRGRMDMMLPSQITEQMKPAAGRIRLDAEVAGTFSDPVLNAGVVLEGLHYPVPEVNMVVSNLNGAVTLSNDQVTIETLTAELGQGSLEIYGDIGMENFTPVSGQARVQAQNIAVSLEDTLEAAFSTDLIFSGSPEKSRIAGTVLMLHGEFYKDFAFDLAEALESRKMGEAGDVSPQSGPGNPLLENIALDIAVNYRDPFILDNNLAFIMVEPDLKITGTISDPVVTGRAQIVEGTIVYQKRQFEIEKGVIDFMDPFRIDPEITLNATCAIRNWVIHMHISGKSDNLLFRLFSDPAETHEDILSLLIIGQTTRELGQGGGSYTGMLTDRAAEMIGQGVESATPLDTFKLGYDESADQGSGVSVTMGKQLSERLMVIYSMETREKETVHTNAAEYKMLENVILRAFNDSLGDFGTEVTLKLEFR